MIGQTDKHPNKQKNNHPNRDSIFIYIDDDSFFKGTVRVILSDPPCKDDTARFTTVHCKALSDQGWIIFQCLSFSIAGFLQKSQLRISTTGKHLKIIRTEYC